MKRETISAALDGLDDWFIREAEVYAPQNDAGRPGKDRTHEKNVLSRWHSPRR